MERQRGRNPQEPSRSFDSPGFLTSTAGVWGPQLEEGPPSLKPQRCQKLIAAALLFNYQFSVELRCSLERA